MDILLRRISYKDSDGTITEIQVTYEDSHGGVEVKPQRKVAGTLHWVSIAHAIPVEVRLYDPCLLMKHQTHTRRKNFWIL
jgi:glutaminyl-tRNA synthetase